MRSKGTIHLLITDVVLPKVSGREFAPKSPASGRRSSYVHVGLYRQRVVNSGILQKEVAFLQKPFTPGGARRESARSPGLRQRQPHPGASE